MIEYNIHFLHLCETHEIDQKNSYNFNNDTKQNLKNNVKQRLTHNKFTHIPSNKIFTIIHNPDLKNTSSGNTIIISPTLYQFIGPVYAIPGRLIHATFFFKQHHQLNIINVYLPPVTSAKQNHQVMNLIENYISKELNNASKYNYYTIMGDFNINPHNRNLPIHNSDNNISIDTENDHPNNNTPMDMDNDDNNITNKTHTFYHIKILKKLKDKHFKDLIKIYINPPPPTFFNAQNHTSYIDIIFGSPNIIPYTTIKQKKYISSTEKINYKKVTTDQWTDFHNFILDEYKRNKPNAHHSNNTQSFVNAFYENFVQSVNRTIKSLNFPIIKNNSHQYEYTHDIRVIQNDIYYILKLIKLSKLYFSVSNNSKHLPLLNFWQNPKKLDRLKRISSDPKIKSTIVEDDQNIIWPNILRHDNYQHISERLIIIHDTLKRSYDDAISQFNKKKIEKYINQRDNNIVTNQRRMLNSILDQKPNIIKIDRLIYNDDNNVKSFTTDPEVIESIIIEHFKKISMITTTDRSYNPNITLRQPWHDIYQPFTHIPSSEINKLIVTITLEELD
ncbi:unnamed protein product [Rhizophagus irregularis]|nr:unnamed protein product [Rhizophagus irregularis]